MIRTIFNGKIFPDFPGKPVNINNKRNNGLIDLILG